MKRILFLVIFLFYPVSALLAIPLILSRDAIYPLEPVMDAAETGADLSFEEIRRGQVFETHRINPHSFQITEGKTNWIRLTVKNETFSQNWILSLNHNRIDYAEFYDPAEDGLFHKQVSGDHLPYSQREIMVSYPAFRFFLKQGESKTMYLRFRTSSVHWPRITVSGVASFTRKNTREESLHLVNFLIALVFSVILFYLYRKEKNHHYLMMIPVIFAFFFTFYLGSGDSYRWWPEWPYFQDRSLYVSMWIGSFIFLFFSLSFLKLKTRSRFFYWIFILALPIGLPGLGIFVRVNHFFIKWIISFGTLSLFLPLIAALWLLGQNRREVKIFLLFLLTIESGFIYRSFIFFGLIDSPEFQFNWPAHLFPLSVLVFLKAGQERYRMALLQKEELEHKYNELVGKLHRSSTASRKHTIGEEERKSVLQKVMAFMESGEMLHDELVTLPGLANHVGVRPDQLSELINRDMGMNFNTFINTIRVHRACELMADFPEKTITEILYESGFQSKTPFYTAFREIMNLSPSEYREKFSREQDFLQKRIPEL